MPRMHKALKPGPQRYMTQTRWPILATPALKFWRQEDEDFKIVLGYVTSWRPEREMRRRQISRAGEPTQQIEAFVMQALKTGVKSPKTEPGSIMCSRA